jgi:hypothetical protein
MELKTEIQKRMAAQAPFGVWTATDLLDLGSRDAIDQALSRMTSAGDIRRITRGLYDLPRSNTLTGKPTNPDPRRVIDALARRDQARMLVDGLTAANDLGLTDAVPAKISVHTDARLRPIKLGAQTITFKLTAPSRLHWAARPAIAADLRDGLITLPDWMRNFLKPLLENPPLAVSQSKPPSAAQGRRNEPRLQDLPVRPVAGSPRCLSGCGAAAWNTRAEHREGFLGQLDARRPLQRR